MTNWFGNFDYICTNGDLPVCQIFKAATTPKCTLSSYKVGSAKILDISNFVVTIISTLFVIILAIKANNKKAAVGRREMCILLCSIVLFNFFNLLSWTMKLGGNQDDWYYIASIATTSMITWALLFFGFVGFQIIPDGSMFSVGLMLIIMGIALAFPGYLAADIMFDVTNTFTINTQKAPTQSIALYLLTIVIPIFAVLCFVTTQTIIVSKFLAVRKPLVWLYAGAVILVAGGILFGMVFGADICKSTSKNVDGAMFVTLCFTIAVYSVYRFWNDITEDEVDEFAVMYKV